MAADRSGVLEARFHPRIDQIPAAAWDALRTDGNPFLSHAFLAALERTGCIREDWGWQAQHVGLYDDQQLEEWVEPIMEAAGTAKRTHVLMNNCYANYGTTNAREIAALLLDLESAA